MLKKNIQYLLQLFYPFFKKLLPYQLYAYLATGGANTALNIILFAVLYQFVLPEQVAICNYELASYSISLLIAFVITVPTGFWLAKHFAFEQNTGKKKGKQLGKYCLVVLQGLASDYLLLKAMIIFLGIHPTVAKIISTIFVLTGNYLLQKHFTFRNNKAAVCG